MASQSGHEIRFTKRREEDALETGQVSLLEEVGSEAREQRIEGRYMAGASSGAAAKENKNEEWTEKHRNVARKLVPEGGWVQQRLFDIGWSDASQCQACRYACHKEEGTEKHRLYHCPEWNEIDEIPEAFKKWEQEARTSKKEWKWQRGIATHPLSESQWNRGHFSMKKSGSLRSTRAGVYQLKDSRATLALFWVPLESGKHVVGQWCSWIMMKNWGFCIGCTVRWRQSLKSSSPLRGRS